MSAVSPTARPRRVRRNLAQVFAWRLRKNKLALFGLVWLILVTGVIALAPVLPLKSPTRIDVRNPFAQPSIEHPLGTDENGRDVLARLIAGGRVSILVGLSAALLTVLIGGVLGVTAGYFGGVVDRVIMRFTDGILSIPVFFLLLAVVALFGSTITVLILALSLTRWMGAARLLRSEVLRIKEMEYTAAARGLGAGHLRIMFGHLLPQALPSLIVATSIGVGNVMLVEAGLSFLGLGISPPTPSWGNMLTASQYYMWSAPQLAVYPGLMILLTVMAFNTLGDVVRDALDPRLRSSGD
ncbi:MAG TPA: ABC transporter permease [Trueperaceae bacterium]|nr:ABC transporter permease [Trueperaceae bacterium]